jgi:hypothetical protein
MIDLKPESVSAIVRPVLSLRCPRTSTISSAPVKTRFISLSFNPCLPRWPSPPLPQIFPNSASTILIAAGPTRTVNNAGKTQRISGKSSFTGVFAARSSAIWLRF